MLSWTRQHHTGRRGAVAVWVALTLTPTLMLIALGLDEAQGGLAKIQLQRVADISAYAGGLRAASTATAVPTSCAAAKSTLSCAETNAAADLAEANAMTGSSTRSWNDGTFSLSDNTITAAIVPGVRSASDVAVSVTVSRSLPSILAYPVDGQANYTVSATATTEVIPGTTTGAQPCMTSLAGTIAIAGNASLTMNGCSLRSNDNVTVSSNANVVAASIYADTTITTGGNGHITGQQFPNSGQISDPYATDAAVQTAFAQLTTQTSTSFSGGGTAAPGVYASMNITANTTLSPGLYVVTGDVTVGGNAAVNGSGVTIVSGGEVTIGGNTNFNVTAPGARPTNGAIPGVLIADDGTSGEDVVGNASSAISGVVYFPNATVTFGGNGATNGQSSCLEVIAASVTVTGNTNMGGNCSQFGASSFGSVQSAATVALVQ